MIYIAVTSQTARAVWFGQTARRRLGKVQTANRGKSQVWPTPDTQPLLEIIRDGSLLTTSHQNQKKSRGIRTDLLGGGAAQ